MYAGQKSVRGGIQDFLCPFTDMFITQGSGGAYSHAGTMANDVRGAEPGVRYPYYAPCDLKCVKVYPDYGQSMWQSTAPVRFANSRVDYATVMVAHSNSQDCYVGQVISQGDQWDNMGDKPQDVCTGVHCHIEISQSADTSWWKNGYGNYQFNNEYDTDDCYFVDNTNIIQGMGGNWRTTNQVPVEEPPTPPEPTGADQILYKGSKVRFDGVFKVDILKSPLSSNLFGCCQLTGCSLNDYKNENVKPYHWLPAEPFTECDSNGNATTDQVLSGGNSWVKNDNIYNVEDIDIPTNSAKLIINGREVWVFSKYLYEVSDK